MVHAFLCIPTTLHPFNFLTYPFMTIEDVTWSRSYQAVRATSSSTTVQAMGRIICDSRTSKVTRYTAKTDIPSKDVEGRK